MSSTTLKSGTTSIRSKLVSYRKKKSRKWYKNMFYWIFSVKVPFYVPDWDKYNKK